MVVDSWYSTVKRANALFDKLSDEEMMNEVAPNRNRGIYLIGHLAAVNDMLLPLLNLREQMYPELKSSFIRTPDNPEVQPFTVAQLRQYWAAVNSELQKHFNNLTDDEWLKNTILSQLKILLKSHTEID